jgi:hypothetical protein
VRQTWHDNRDIRDLSELRSHLGSKFDRLALTAIRTIPAGNNAQLPVSSDCVFDASLMPDPSVPEYFGYARAPQVSGVEPSFIDPKRLLVALSRGEAQIAIVCENLFMKMTALNMQNPE